MKQPHHALNTLNNNQTLVVAFNVDLPPEETILSYGVPRLLGDGLRDIAVELVPAPTEGPGRFALNFIPAFGEAFGHYTVEVEIDVVLASMGDVTLDRTIHFLVLRPEGDGISVTPQSPVDQVPPAEREETDTVATAAIEEGQNGGHTRAGEGSGVSAPTAPPAPTAPTAPEPLTDEQRATAAAVAEQAQAALNQSAADQPAAGDQPQI